MTQSPETPRCAYCRRILPERTGGGRPPRYCRRSHRQRAYEARRRAARAELPAGQVVVVQRDLDHLHDLLYTLEAALDDVDADLHEAAGRSARVPADAYRAALDHLRQAAGDLNGLVIEPVTA